MNQSLALYYHHVYITAPNDGWPGEIHCQTWRNVFKERLIVVCVSCRLNMVPFLTLPCTFLSLLCTIRRASSGHRSIDIHRNLTHLVSWIHYGIWIAWQSWCKNVCGCSYFLVVFLSRCGPGQGCQGAGNNTNLSKWQIYIYKNLIKKYFYGLLVCTLILLFHATPWNLESRFL